MPNRYVQITVKKELHEKLKEFSEETCRTIPNTIEYCLRVAKAFEAKDFLGGRSELVQK